MINDESFYIVVDFNKPEYVSQYTRQLDSVTLTVLKPEAFTNTFGEPAKLQNEG